MNYKDWKATFKESEETFLKALTVYLRYLASCFPYLAEAKKQERSEVEKQGVIILSLTQAIHMNIQQRNWLLSDMDVYEENRQCDNCEQFADSIQELLGEIACRDFISKENKHRMDEILKQMSNLYPTSVRISIRGKSSPAPPWQP